MQHALKRNFLLKSPVWKLIYEVILSFNGDMGDTLLESAKVDHDRVVFRMRAAEIIKKKILQMEYRFKSSI